MNFGVVNRHYEIISLREELYRKCIEYAEDAIKGGCDNTSTFPEMPREIYMKVLEQLSNSGYFIYEIRGLSYHLIFKEPLPRPPGWRGFFTDLTSDFKLVLFS